MELYLLMAFVMIYIITSFFVKTNVQNKIWTLAFIVSFVVTSVSIGFLRVNNQDVMMAANELNWYYLLYLFGSMSVVLGVINLWMYRRALWHIIFSNNTKDEDSDDEDEDEDEDSDK